MILIGIVLLVLGIAFNDKRLVNAGTVLVILGCLLALVCAAAISSLPRIDDLYPLEIPQLPR